MKNAIRFASIGDCCADIYTPDKKVVLGGTAYNVAIAARNAGASVSIVSAIGSDAVGKQFLRNFKKNNIDTSHLTVAPRKTSSIPIYLDKDGKPSYGPWKLAAMTDFRLSQSDKIFLHGHDVVRAVLFTPIESFFRQFCELNIVPALKIGDFAGSSSDSIDVSQIESYVNRLDIIIKSVQESSSKSLTILKSLAQRYNCMVLALLGSQGSMVFTNSKTYREPAQKIRTKNTTGAGDTYQAYFLTNYLRTHDIQTAMREATRAAAELIGL